MDSSGFALGVQILILADNNVFIQLTMILSYTCAVKLLGFRKLTDSTLNSTLYAICLCVFTPVHTGKFGHLITLKRIIHIMGLSVYILWPDSQPLTCFQAGRPVFKASSPASKPVDTV